MGAILSDKKNSLSLCMRLKLFFSTYKQLYKKLSTAMIKLYVNETKTFSFCVLPGKMYYTVILIFNYIHGLSYSMALFDI